MSSQQLYGAFSGDVQYDADGSAHAPEWWDTDRGSSQINEIDFISVQDRALHRMANSGLGWSEDSQDFSQSSQTATDLAESRAESPGHGLDMQHKQAVTATLRKQATLDIDQMFEDIDTNRATTPTPSRLQQDFVNVQCGPSYAVLGADELQYLAQMSSSQSFDASAIAGPSNFALPPALPQNTPDMDGQNLQWTNEFTGASAMSAVPTDDGSSVSDPNFMNLVIRVAFKLTMAQPFDPQEAQFYSWMELYNSASLFGEQESADLDIESMVVPMHTPQHSAMSQILEAPSNDSSRKLVIDVQVKEHARRMLARAKTWSPQALNSLSSV